MKSTRRSSFRLLYLAAVTALLVWALNPVMQPTREPRGFLHGPEYTTEFGGRAWSGPIRVSTSDGWVIWFALDHNSVIAVEGGDTTYGKEQWIWQVDELLMIRDASGAVRPFPVAGRRDLLLLVKAGQPLKEHTISPDDFTRAWALTELYPHERKAIPLLKSIGRLD